MAAPLCPLQLGTARFRSLAWSAPGAAPYQRCALCATVAHTTVVLDTPNSSLEWKLQVLAHLAPLVLRAAGGPAPPRPGAAPYTAWATRAAQASEAEQLQMRVASCAWTAARAPAAAASFVALGGASALAVVRVAHHASGGARRAATLAWSQPAGSGGAAITAVHFATTAGAAEAPPLALVVGRADGSIRLELLRPSADGAALAAAASLRIAAPSQRPVHTLTSCALAGGGVQLLCASGPLVLAYEIDTGGGDGGVAQASLVAQHAHVQYVTSLAALPHGRGYLSASVDGVLNTSTRRQRTTTTSCSVVVDVGLAAARGGHKTAYSVGYDEGSLSTSIRCRRRPRSSALHSRRAADRSTCYNASLGTRETRRGWSAAASSSSPSPTRSRCSAPLGLAPTDRVALARGAPLPPPSQASPSPPMPSTATLTCVRSRGHSSAPAARRCRRRRSGTSA